MFRTKKRLLLLSISVLLIITMLSSVYNVRLGYSATFFNSDFETGNLNQWTGTIYGGGASPPTVQQSIIHHGSFALRVTGTSGWSVVYKDLASYENILYFRTYMRFTATPASGQFINIYPMFAYDSVTPLAYMHIYNNGGILNWRLVYRTDSNVENFALSASPSIQINQWYYIEIMYKVGNGNGEAKAWIAPAGSGITEGSPTISIANLTNDNYNIGHLQLGFYTPSSLALNVYHDCVIVSNTYIGVESSGNSAPTYSNVGYSSTIAGSSCTFSSYWNDDTGLSTSIFSTNNTGTWLNDTATAFSSTPGWTRTTKILNAGAGVTVGYRWFASDTNNVWNSTSIQTLITTSQPQPRGVVSIAFDDDYQNQYDYAIPLMSSRKINGTFYVVTSHIGGSYMTVSELQSIQGAGNEIGSHSVAHQSFTGLTDQQIIDECVNSKQYLLSNGLSATNFAYPNGDTNDHVDSLVSQYYRSGRTAYVAPYTMLLSEYHFRVAGFSSEDYPNELQSLKDMVDQAYATNSWVIIFFHNIVPNDYSSPYTTSAEDFASFLDYTLNKGVQILTVNQTLNTLQLPPNAAPTYSNIGYSSSAASSNCVFSSLWNDDSGLSKYIFSTNNTGLWVNDTIAVFSSTPSWANVTKTLNSVVGVTVGYRWFVNDINNVWTSTPIQTLTTTGSSSPFFVSGFENGDFREWTTIDAGNGGVMPMVQSTTRHHGVYAAQCQITTQANSWSEIRKSFGAGYQTAYHRVYVRFSATPTNNNYMYLSGIRGNSITGDVLAGVALYNNAGSLRWVLWYYRDGGMQYAYSSAPTVNINTWYSIEIMTTVHPSAGSAKAWIVADGGSINENSPTISITGIANDNVGQAQHIVDGLWAPAGLTCTVQYDCIAVDDTYIGVESSGNSAPTYSNVGYSSTIAGSSCTFSSYWNDDTGLSRYIFSTNITGTWVNHTSVPFASTPSWANLTLTLPSTVGQVVGYRWFANDINNAWNSTGIKTLTTSSLAVNIQLYPSTVMVRYTFEVGTTWMAPEQIIVNGQTMTFSHWSDGSTNLSRTFTTSGTYTVIYE